MTGDRLPGKILQQLAGSFEFIAELLFRLVVDQLMAPPVGADLMAMRGDLAHKVGIAIGDPAEDKAGRSNARLLVQLEQSSHIRFDSCRLAFPRRSVDRVREGGDLEVLFDVNRHCVDGSGFSAHPQPRILLT